MNKGGRPKGFLTKPEKYQYSKAYLRQVRSLKKNEIGRKKLSVQLRRKLGN